VSKEEYCKKIAPGVCPLNYKLYKSPPMPGWGVVRHDIDRCIIIISKFMNSCCLQVKCVFIKGCINNSSYRDMMFGHRLLNGLIEMV